MKHGNLAVFVPHIGCPNQCSFCDQRVISGKADAPSPQSVAELCRTALLQMGERAQSCEIAFFGGSFTAIDRAYMVSLLQAACTYVGPSGFLGIRVSTRPDAIDQEVLDILQAYKVTSIELGAQSMEDEVLQKNLRGHSGGDVIRAAHQIKARGFMLGLQMMLGLYGDTAEGARDTARKLIELSPDTVRVYPTIVIKNTLLAKLLELGEYRPMMLEEAVVLCAQIMEQFETAGVRIIRVGLHASQELEGDMLAGPYHPAFRELCESRLLLQRILKDCEGKGVKEFTVMVHPKELSKAIGQRRANLVKLEELGYKVTITADSHCQPGLPQVLPIGSRDR